jgi:hypothetical protein
MHCPVLHVCFMLCKGRAFYLKSVFYMEMSGTVFL